ncbi:hypothetical protein A0H81_03416 [Grifola frondosa]|uniref:DNA endonuclease activator Ctp1 C-terminal domain-containing protein n=1 Tax=Grifola frondosa TaxID=5627 RepID=A0A1C7MJ36_GRIFR|nr:hypothetical protein A0H81_03416 [Grifola frondosa]
MVHTGTSHSQTSSKQVELLENKVNNLRWWNEDLHRRVFDTAQRGHCLAVKMGFKDLDAAEFAVEAQSDVHTVKSTAELTAHFETLQNELADHVRVSKAASGALEEALQAMGELRKENVRLNEDLECVEEEKGALKRRVCELESLIERKSAPEVPALGSGIAFGESSATVIPVLSPHTPSSTTVDNPEHLCVSAQLRVLRTKYDSLLRAKERNDAKHTLDYQKWKAFKDWMCKEERKEGERCAKRRKIDDENNGENSHKRFVHRVRKQYQKMGPCISSSANGSNTPPGNNSKGKNADAPDGNLTIPLSGDKQNTIATASVSAPKSQLSSQLSIPQKSKRKLDEDLPNSSETECESEETIYFFPSQPTRKNISCSPHESHERLPDSSETEYEPEVPLSPAPSSTVAPSQPLSTSTPKPRHGAERTQQLWTPISPDHGMPAHSAPTNRITSSLLKSVTGRNAAIHTPVARDNTSIAVSKENAENVVANSSTGKKYPSDYSIYKGRGRYAADAHAGDTTINALFKIDSAQNDGVGFQFDEVVRDKQRRRHLHAGDCECCRDYYEAIGPLPPRLQAPLWRSPESTPSKPSRASVRGKQQGANFDGDLAESSRQAAIAQHKGAISRHRQQWTRASTPPGYWDIGFPDTQQVSDINESAREMHERKRAMVELEVRCGGRYKRRGSVIM